MDRRTVLAVALSMAVIFIYQFFLLPKPPAPRRAPQASKTPPPPTPVPASEAPALSPAPAQPSTAGSDAELSRLLAAQARLVPGQITVNTDLFQVTFSSKGAAVTSWRLLKYTDGAGQPLEMVPPPSPGTSLPLAVMFKDESLTRAFSEGLFLIEEGEKEAGRERDRQTLVFTRVDPSGIRLAKRLVFHRQSYLVEASVTVSNLLSAVKDVPWWLSWGPGVGREGDGGGKYSVGPLVFAGGGVSSSTPKNDGDRLSVPAGFQWIGLHDRYFLAAFIPDKTLGDAFILRHGKPLYSVGMGPGTASLPGGGQNSLAGSWFVGPKSVDILSSYKLGLEGALDFGWFGWLGRPLLSILKFFHRFVANWGVAIILLTLLVRLFLFPVSFNMYKSMRRMQEFQPQIQALKKKYKDDPQAMNKEMMDLYRANKINPMGGCLPMLIQIPIFIALYRVLSIAIELRGSSFLHIGDLSSGETTVSQFIHHFLPSIPEGFLPIKILVVLMGVTMFIQQRLSPSMGDPRQAKMMMFLPVIFTAMFWNFTSGLVVYFLFSNILAILEQLVIRKWTKPTELPVEVRPGKK